MAVSLVLGLGLEHSCPWPREVLSSERLSLALASDFFVSLASASSLVSSTPPLIITTMKPKSSCGIDDIPSKVIKFTPNNILTALSHIFNLSLSQGKFIEHLKTAKIIPIYKKGDSKNITNYQPISLLSCFSKLLEKIVQVRLTNFLEKK